MADRSVVVRLRAEVDRYVAGMHRAKSATTDLGKELTGQGKTAQRQLDQLGNAATVMAGGMVLAFGAAAKAAIDWESAFAGVEKTVDGTASQMAKLEAGLRDMAKELPASHAEIAAVAEAAGQLGIGVNDVEDFTRVMIDLGETTNLTAEEAATSLARISNIMGTAASEVDRMGSTIVELGNNSATTEAEIVELATRLAAAGKIAGLSEADVFAFASTLTSVGVEAEAGGTALSKVFTSIRDAVLDGSENLDTFASVAGVTAEEFARSFREDPAMAIESFVTGLGRMNEAGQSTTGVFEDLELTDQRLMRALLSTGSAGGLLAEQIAMANDAWGANNALQTEAEKRYATTGAQLEMLRNQVVDFGVDMGQVLLPAINAAIDVLGTMADGLASMPGPAKVAIAGFGGLTLAVSSGIAVAVKLVPKIRELRNTLISLGPAGRVAAASMPWLAAAGAAVAALTYVVGRNAQAQQEAEARAQGYAEAIRNVGNAVEGTTDQVLGLMADSSELSGFMADAGISAEALGEALAGTDAEWASMRDSLLAAAEASGITGMQLEALSVGLDQQREAAQTGAKHAEDYAKAAGDAGDEAAGAAGGVDDLAGSLDEQAQAAEEARKAFNDLLDAYRASVDPLFGMLDAVDGNRDAQEKLNEVLNDSESTAADIDKAYRDVAKSALDVEVASRELAYAVQDGTVSVDQAKGMLAEWVAQGLITEEQAGKVAEQFGAAEFAANLFAGEYVAEARAETAEAEEDLKRLSTWLDAVNRSVTARIQVQLNNPYAHVTGPQLGRADGGVVPRYLASGGQSGPRGTDTIPAWLTPGEFVLRKQAVDKLGLEFLEFLNAARFANGGAVPMASGGEIPQGWDLHQAQRESGHLSDRTWRNYLQQRLQYFHRYSDEWMDAQRRLEQLDDEIADNQKRRAAERAEREDTQYQLGLLSASRYQRILEERLANTKSFSSEWMQIHRDLVAVTEDTWDRVFDAATARLDARAQQKTLADAQRGVDDAKSELAAARNEARDLQRLRDERGPALWIDAEIAANAQRQADAKGKVVEAEENLASVARRLVEAQRDLIGTGKAGEAHWRALAQQAGFTRKEIDALVDAHKRLAQVQKITSTQDMIRGEFARQGLSLTAGDTRGESGSQRVARIARELESGARTWAEVAKSISRLPGARYHARGGPVGTDTVPAWLTPGEFVMQKSAVDRFGLGFMAALNQGQMSPGKHMEIHGDLVVQTSDSFRHALDEGLWRVVS